MKKLGLFLVSLSLFCLAAFNACKGTTEQADDAGSDEMEAVEEAVDTAAVEEAEMDTTMIDDEAVEEAAE
ncbi:MAG: hypothetical protein GVY19_12445 [Bacteroidetes bacterium]|jgi:hypothetical protein|nr:hypothetical protein [Bacteroidota bacterium]